MRPARRQRGALLLLLVPLACGPRPGPVLIDPLGLLAPDQARAIEAQHAQLLRDHDIDFHIEIASDTADLLAHAVVRFGERGVGSRSAAGHGLLLLLDPARDRVRLEVGHSLEGVYTDAFVRYLEERQMVPFFRAGRVADGLLASTELVVTRAQQAAAQGGIGAAVSGTGGAGAETRARLDAGRDVSFEQAPDVAPGATPEASVDAYLHAMASRNANPRLALYSAATRRVLAERVVTPAQMDALARAYRGCRPEPARVEGDRAVLRYPSTARQCAPFFLRREEGAWRLDLATAGRVLRFGAGNAWHFGPGQHPYRFAFTDWRIDAQGFPHAR